MQTCACKAQPATKAQLSRVCWCWRNDEGYRNLIKLVSSAHLEPKHRGVLDRDDIAAHGDGLIVLSGAARATWGAWRQKGICTQPRRRRAGGQNDFQIATTSK
ncbi:MAG: PHP domain-containing protein [Gammaproteobacteria bacterium]|nr:PHP domain-containing protein [Gammaproteobacteria bacterium]